MRSLLVLLGMHVGGTHGRWGLGLGYGRIVSAGDVLRRLRVRPFLQKPQGTACRQVRRSHQPYSHRGPRDDGALRGGSPQHGRATPQQEAPWAGALRGPPRGGGSDRTDPELFGLRFRLGRQVGGVKLIHGLETCALYSSRGDQRVPSYVKLLSCRDRRRELLRDIAEGDDGDIDSFQDKASSAIDPEPLEI